MNTKLVAAIAKPEAAPMPPPVTARSPQVSPQADSVRTSRGRRRGCGESSAQSTQGALGRKRHSRVGRLRGELLQRSIGRTLHYGSRR